VEEVLQYLDGTQDDAPLLEHQIMELRLPLRKLTEEDAQTADAEAAKLRAEYEAELAKLEANPELRHEPRWHKPLWYVPVTKAYRRMRWYERVRERFEQQKHEDAVRDVTLHVIRLGEVAIATDPFEYYLDFGVYIKARSPATQTFLVQLAGAGTYVPSARSIAGGGYGSLPASTPIGPDGGREVADRTIETLLELWSED
ncbi:MAG: hypothetical protein ACQER1_13840, partial [Armatimonadota bacterium]